MNTALHHRLTPTQQKIIDRHLAFKAKIAAQAKPDPGISCPSASAKIRDEPCAVVTPDVPSWIERQKQIELPKPKEPWFEIIAEIGPIPPIEVREIIRAVADDYGIAPDRIICASRTVAVVRPRQVAMLLSHELTGHSLPALGRRFGRRDHTTLMHGIKKIRQLCQTDSALHERVKNLRIRIREQHDARYLLHASSPSPASSPAPDQASASAGRHAASAVDPQG